jgi:hypothetical protein
VTKPVISDKSIAFKGHLIGQKPVKLKNNPTF